MNRARSKVLSTTQLHIQDIIVELTRKNVKNINLRVTQPEGQVRVSAPKGIPTNLIYEFVVSKYDWILVQQQRLEACAKNSGFVYQSGETHYCFDQQYELQCVESTSKPKVVLNGHILELHVKQQASCEKRQSILEAWYRDQLKNQIPILIDKYELLMNLKVKEFGVKKMKTRWGTCNPKAKRIWLNLELAKKPMNCLEYVVLHEMTHFLEANHNQRFYNFVSEYMPAWKMAEQKLSSP
ncbi:MAG: M48 family metallopeptidase [Gammaproteobacteria bacterium]